MALDFRFDERVSLFQKLLVEKGKGIWDKVDLYPEEKEISIYLHLNTYTPEISKETYEILCECISEYKDFGAELKTSDWWHAGLYFKSELKDNIFPFEIRDRVWEGKNLPIPYYVEQEILRILGGLVSQKTDVVLELQGDDLIIVDIKKRNHCGQKESIADIESKLHSYIESKNFIPVINWAEN